MFAIEFITESGVAGQIIVEQDRDLYRATLVDQPQVQAYGTSPHEAVRKIKARAEAAQDRAA